MERPEFQTWLDEATHGLSRQAAASVRAELEAHYADQVSAALDDGMAEDEAHRTALRGMGDARTARRAFRREYLTTDDEERLSYLRTKGHIAFRYVTRFRNGVIAFVILQLAHIVISYEGAWWWFAGALAWALVLLYGQTRLVRPLARQNRLVDAMRMYWYMSLTCWLMVPVTLLVSVSLGGLGSGTFGNSIIGLPFAVLAFVLEYRAYSALERKLRALERPQTEGRA